MDRKDPFSTVRIILEYDSLGNIVGKKEKDSNTHIEYSFRFYPGGKLKYRHHYFHNTTISEEYFDENGNSIVKAVEEPPSPKGGLNDWNRFLASNLLYPDFARRTELEGVVYVWFMVDAAGNIKNPEIMNPEQVHHSLAKEALRVVKKYPHRWTPGYKDGLAIPFAMRMPINFSLKLIFIYLI